MSKNEQRIFELIQQNPFLSQNALAEMMGLSRSSVANVIASLTQQGYLKGRAYIIQPPSSIVCIGAANVDKKIKTLEPLKSHTSNPVTSSISIGGVARNVAENLGRLGNAVSLLSVCGDDAEWQRIYAHSSPFINLDRVARLEGKSTGTYTALLDANGEMYLGLADMSIYQYLDPHYLAQQTALFQYCRCIVADLNLSQSSLEYLGQVAQKYQKQLILIAVSEPKMANLPQNLTAIDSFIVNLGEAKAYFNRPLNTPAEIEQAVQDWLHLGIKQVILTTGSKQLLVGTQQNIKWYGVKSLAPDQIVDVTGAGDSFSAAFIDALLAEKPQDECVLAGLTNAYHTIQSIHTVRPNLTRHQLTQEMQEY